MSSGVKDIFGTSDVGRHRTSVLFGSMALLKSHVDCVLEAHPFPVIIFAALEVRPLCMLATVCRTMPSPRTSLSLEGPKKTRPLGSKRPALRLPSSNVNREFGVFTVTVPPSGYISNKGRRETVGSRWNRMNMFTRLNCSPTGLALKASIVVSSNLPKVSSVSAHRFFTFLGQN